MPKYHMLRIPEDLWWAIRRKSAENPYIKPTQQTLVALSDWAVKTKQTELERIIDGPKRKPPNKKPKLFLKNIYISIIIFDKSTGVYRWEQEGAEEFEHFVIRCAKESKWLEGKKEMVDAFRKCLCQTEQRDSFEEDEAMHQAARQIADLRELFTEMAKDNRWYDERFKSMGGPIETDFLLEVIEEKRKEIKDANDNGASETELREEV